MKARDLAKELMRFPNADVMISVDVSTDESNFDDRAFAEEIECVQSNKRDDPNDDLTVSHCSIISIGYFNNRSPKE